MGTHAGTNRHRIDGMQSAAYRLCDGGGCSWAMNALGWRLLIELIFAFAVAIVVLLSLFQDAPAQDAIPRLAYRYRGDLIRNARFVFGLEAPTSTFASQIHIESGWVANARNRSGASGLGQFLGPTARHITRKYPELRKDGGTLS